MRLFVRTVGGGLAGALAGYAAPMLVCYGLLREWITRQAGANAEGLMRPGRDLSAGLVVAGGIAGAALGMLLALWTGRRSRARGGPVEES